MEKENIFIPTYYFNKSENNYFYNFEHQWLSTFIEKILLNKLYEYFTCIIKRTLNENESLSLSHQENINELVEMIWNLFLTNGGKICGGFFTTLFSSGKQSLKTDMDIFFNPNSCSHLSYIENIIRLYFKKDIFIKKTNNALSFLLESFNKDLYNSKNGSIRIYSLQFIKPEICSGYTVKDIIKTFDFTICQFGYDIKSKTFTQAKCFDEHIREKKLYVSPFFSEKLSKKRIDKYIQIKKFCIAKEF